MPGLFSGYFVPLGIAFQTKGFARLQSEFGRYESMTNAIMDRNNRIVSSNERLLRSVGAVAVGFGALGAMGLAQTYAMTKAAEQYNRTERSVTMLAYAHGVEAQALASERAELYELNISMATSEEAMRALEVAGVGLVHTSELVAAAQDMASFSGEKLVDVLDAYTSAVTSATTRGLRQYHIAASTEKVFKWYAESVLGVDRALTQLERRQAVLEYILYVNSQIAGVYTQNVNEAAERTEALAAAWDDASVKAGQALLPTMMKAIGYLEILVEWFSSLDEEQQGNTARWVAWTSAIMAGFAVLSMILPAAVLFGRALGALGGILVKFIFNATLAGAAGTGLTGVFTGIGASATAAGGGVAALGAFLTALLAILLKVTAVGIALGGIVLAVKWGTEGVFGEDIWERIGTRAEERYQELLAEATASSEEAGEEAGEGYSIGFLRGIESQGDVAMWRAEQLVEPFIEPAFDPETAGMDFIRRWLAGAEEATAEEAQQVADRLKDEIQPVLWGVQDTLFDIRSEVYRLDSALWPLEVTMRRIQAATDLITIPMERQRRILQRQLEDLQRMQKAEEERQERYLKQLERQAEELKRLIDIDTERLHVLDWEIFIEEQRNKILGRETSKRLIEMRTEYGYMEDQRDGRQVEYDLLREQIKAEKERLEAIKEIADAQIEALQDQIWVLDRMIDLEKERARYAEEELKLAEAAQVEDRIRAESAQRYWEEEQRRLQHQLSILNRVKELTDDLEVDEDFMADIMRGIDEGYADYAATVREDMEALMDDLKEEMPSLLQAILGIEPEDEEEVLSGWERFKLRLQSWHEAIVEETGALRSPAEVFADYDKQGTKLEQRLADTWQNITNWWGKITGRIDELPTAEPEVAAGLMASLTPEGRESALAAAWEGTKSWWSTDVVPWVQGAWTTISEATSGGLTTLMNDAAIGWDNIKATLAAKVPEAWESIKTWASEKWDEFTTWAVTEWDSLGTDVVVGWANIKTTVSTAVTDAWEGFKTGASTAWTTFTTWISETLDDLRTRFLKTQIGAVGTFVILWLYQAYLDIKTWFEENKPFQTIGENIVGGIRKGIEDAWEGFKTWLEEQMQGLPDIVKKWLGIESPSKLFIPHGKGIAAGIQKGFELSWDKWTPKIGTDITGAFGTPRMVQGNAPATQTTVNNYYITKQAPQVSVDAHYARVQAAGTIAADVQQILSVL